MAGQYAFAKSAKAVGQYSIRLSERCIGSCHRFSNGHTNQVLRRVVSEFKYPTAEKRSMNVQVYDRAKTRR
jgi:hypothetical protein